MDVMTHSGLRLSYLSSLGSRLGAYSSTYCAPGSPRSGGVVAYFGALLYFTFRLASAFGSKSQIWPIRTPLWPAFSSRVSRRTAFILIAPDKCFPWHTISPFPPSLVVLFRMPKHFNDTGFQAFSSLAELMERGPTEQNNLQTFFFWKAKQGAREEKRNRGGKIWKSPIKDMC